MRLLLDADLQPGHVERLRALSPDLEVVDRQRRRRRSTSTTLADPDVEAIFGRRAPADLARVPRLRWLQVPSAGVDHLADDPPWRKGLLVTNARGVFAVPIGEYVTGTILRIHQPAATWARTRRPIAGPTSEPLATVVRGKTAVLAGYGSIGREVARQLAALGMRILAVKPRPEVRDDPSYRVPGTGDPDGTIPERIVGLEALVEAVREADVLVLTMPLDRRVAQGHRRDGPRGPAADGLADQRLARPAGRRAGAARGPAGGPAGRRRARRLRARSRCRRTARGGTPRT